MNWLRKTRAGILLAIAFIAGLVGFLPAHLFESRLNEALQAPWKITVGGSVWNGAGVLRSVPSTGTLTVPITWKFAPRALTRLRAAWHVVPASPALSGSAKIGVGWQSVEISDAALAVDAGTLSQIFPVIALLAPTGNLLVTTPTDAPLAIAYGRDFHARGETEIRIDNLGVGPAGPQPLGNYLVKITARDTIADYKIIQSGGALKLDGGGSIQTAAPRTIAYAGHATPSPTLPENVLSMLKSIGKPDAEGRLSIDWKAPW